jgi:hypothetical protein
MSSSSRATTKGAQECVEIRHFQLRNNEEYNGHSRRRDALNCGVLRKAMYIAEKYCGHCDNVCTFRCCSAVQCSAVGVWTFSFHIETAVFFLSCQHAQAAMKRRGMHAQAHFPRRAIKEAPTTTYKTMSASCLLSLDLSGLNRKSRASSSTRPV